jgi:DNA-binding response OmpR family regulator
MADPGIQGNDLQVLAVTDDHHLREELEFGFPQKIQVVSRVDARDAIRSMLDATPSVVVVDQQTGSSGALSLLKEMQQHPSLASIPVLVLLERTQDAWLARSFGASAYLTKPVETGELVDKLLKLIS